jgi:hypothetical protein
VPAPSLPTVRVAVLRSGGRDDDREALRAWASEVTSAPVTVERRCRECGATDHGRPSARTDGRAIGVGLARAGGLLVLAVGPLALGVDVERVSRVATGPLDAVGPEHGGDALVATRVWAAKEAVLKRDGRGLRVDPRDLRVRLDGRAARVSWRGGRGGRVRLADLDGDTVLAVAAPRWARLVIEDRRGR